LKIPDPRIRLMLEEAIAAGATPEEAERVVAEALWRESEERLAKEAPLELPDPAEDPPQEATLLEDGDPVATNNTLDGLADPDLQALFGDGAPETGS
jgi:hypothetical protein